MPTNIVVPPLGESVLEATVGEWLKKPGETVAVGDPLVRLETDKVDLEVGADHAGVLSRIAAETGADVKVGDVLGVLGETETPSPDAGEGSVPRAAEAAVKTPTPGPSPDAEEGSARAAEAAVAGEPSTPGPAPDAGAGTVRGAGDGKRGRTPEAAAGEPAAQAAGGTPGGNGETPAPEAGEGGTRAAAEAEAGAAEVTPLARRVAEELGIDLAQVPGSGPKGRVTKEDVEGYAQRTASAEAVEAPPSRPAAPAAEGPAREEPASRPAAPAPEGAARETPAAQPAAAGVLPAETRRETLPAQPARPTEPGGQPAPAPQPTAAATAALPAETRRETRARMSRRRQTIARRLVEAQHTAAMLTTFNEIDMTAVMDMRKRRKDAFRERYGVNLGFTSFFVKASIGALRAFPRLNAEIQGDEMVLKEYYDIGIAVGASEGLVVPVLRDADRLDFGTIEQQVKGFAEKAQQGTLTLEDLRGGTFTITNGGVFGSLMSTPILNPPQVGILGLHKIEERPVARSGQVEIRPMMYVALSYDHRIVDGREAVQFLVRVKELIEDPEALLLEG